jgi:hypothetical protein
MTVGRGEGDGVDHGLPLFCLTVDGLLAMADAMAYHAEHTPKPYGYGSANGIF